MTMQNKMAELMGKAVSQNTGTTEDNSKKAIKTAIMDMVKSLEMIKSEREHIKDIAKSLKENHQIQPKVSNKVAKLVHKGDKPQDDEFTALVDNLYAAVQKL
jgi:DNA topoisomerase VI subunit B